MSLGSAGGFLPGTQPFLPQRPGPPPKPSSSLGSTYSTGTFPGKAPRWAPGLLAHSSTLPLPSRQDKPPAAAVRPFTPELAEPPPSLQRPQTLAASSIYSMYTQQGAPGKSFHLGGQGTLPRQPRGASSSWF